MLVKDLDSKLRAKVLDAFLDGNRQMGDVNYTEEERAQLKEFYLSLGLNQNWTMEAAELATAFLVSVIKNYKGDWTGKEFWDRIYPQIGWKPDYTIGLPAIADALTRYNRPLFISKSGIHKYVESLFYQAYSPQTSVKSFIKLAWSLYTNQDVFDLTYFDTESDGRLCEAIIGSLNSHYKDVDFDSDFVFESATYSIRAGLRYAFEKDKKGATLILRRILKYIVYIYQKRDKVDEDQEGYLAHLCNDSVPRLIASYSESSNITRTPRARETIDDIDKIKGTYVFQNGLLNLYFPKIRLYRDVQQFKQATVRLFMCLGEERIEIAKKVYECVGEDYKHILREIYFPIQEYLDFFGDEISLAATLSFDDKEPSYDSKKTLFRKFFVFKDDIESKASLLTPGDYRIVFPSNFVLNENIHSNEEPIIRDQHIVDISLNDGDRISFNGSYVFFGQKETGAHFFFEEQSTEEVENILFKGNSPEPYQVYKKLGNFIIRTDDIVRADHLDVQLYSDEGRILARYPLSKMMSENGIYTLSFAEDILTANKNNDYLLIIVVKDQTTDKYYFNKHIVVLSDIHISFGESPYISEETTDTTISFSNEEYVVKNSNQNTTTEINTKIGIAEVQIPYFSWKINQEDYRWTEISQSLPRLREEFQSNDLLFINTFYKNVKVFCGDVEIKESNKKGQFLIGQFVNSPQGHKAFIDGEDVFAVIDFGEETFEFPLFSVTSEPYLLDENADSFISFENGNLSVNLKTNYHGSAQSIFKIVLEGRSSKNYHYEKTGDLNEEIIIKGISSDVYHITISHQEPFSSGDYWNIMWSDDLEIGDLNEIRFQDVSRICIYKMFKCKIKNLYLTNIEYLGDDGFGLRYSCKMHSDWFKAEYCEFVINDGTRMFSTSFPIVNLYYRDKDLVKEYSFDTGSNSLSKQPVDGNRYHECLSIYAKTE